MKSKMVPLPSAFILKRISLEEIKDALIECKKQRAASAWNYNTSCIYMNQKDARKLSKICSGRMVHIQIDGRANLLMIQIGDLPSKEILFA